MPPHILGQSKAVERCYKRDKTNIIITMERILNILYQNWKKNMFKYRRKVATILQSWHRCMSPKSSSVPAV
jgi:hypothetical protein